MNDEHRDDEHDGAAPEPSDEAVAEPQPEPNLDEVEPELLATFTEIGIVETRRAIEAILLVATDPTPASLLAQLLEVPVEHVELLCHALADSYEEANHGFQLVKVAGGWRFQTHPDMAPYVERFAMDGQSTKLSNAALETLAIVAYKQPISRAQVSAIRGVNVDAVLRTLVQRGYVDEVGRDTGAGQAVLFGTTSMFLERLGINAVTDLPALGDFVPSAEVVEALEQTLKVDLDSDLGVIDPDEEAPARTTTADAGGDGEAPTGEGDEQEQPEDLAPDAAAEAETEVADEVAADAEVGVGVEFDASADVASKAGDDTDGSAADADSASGIPQGAELVESVTDEAESPPAAEDMEQTEPEVPPAADQAAEADPGDQPEPAEHDEAPIEVAADTEPVLVDTGEPTDSPRENELAVAEVGDRHEVASTASDGVGPADAGEPTDFPREIESAGAADAARPIEVDQRPDFRRETLPPGVDSSEAVPTVAAEPVGRESAADGAGEEPATASPQAPAAPGEVVGDAEASPKSGAAGHAGGSAPIDDRQQPTGPADGGEPQLAGSTPDPMAGARSGIDTNGHPVHEVGGSADHDGVGGHGTDRDGWPDTSDLDAHSDATSGSGAAGSGDGRFRPGTELGSGATGSGQPNSFQPDSRQLDSAHPGGQTGAGGRWRPSASSAGGAGQPVTGRGDRSADRPGPFGNPGVAPASAPTGAAPAPAGPAAQPDDPDPGHDRPVERHGLPAASHDPATSPEAETNREPGGFLHRPAVPGDGPGSPGLVGAVDPAAAPSASLVTGPEPVVHLDPVIDLTAEAVSEPDADRA